MFGVVEHENPKRTSRHVVTLKHLVQQSVQTLQNNLQLGDWSLDPDIQDIAQEDKVASDQHNPDSWCAVERK